MKKNLTIDEKRTKAQMMRMIGVSAGVIKRRGWDDGTLRRKAARMAARQEADRPARGSLPPKRNRSSKSKREADRQRARGFQL